MKIGIDISQLVFEGTGVASYTKSLVKNLLLSGDFEQYVLFGSSLRRQDKLTHYLGELGSAHLPFTAKLFHIPPSVLTVLWNRLHVVSIEKLIGRVDIFHSSDWIEPPSAARKVTTIHDLIVYKYPENLPNSIVANQKQKLAWVKKESDIIIADSKSTKSDIIKYLNFPEEKINVVYLGVDEAFYPRKIDLTTRVRSKYNIAKNYILCVGTREPRKNLDRIVKAYKSLKLKEYVLVIAGNPGWGRDIRSGENIIVTGFVPDEDLAALYSGCACFVYPSLYEGFGLPVLEAMACGALVITSNKGSLAEIVGNCARIVEPEEFEDIAAKISQVLALPPKERGKMIVQGIAHAKTFTWKKTAAETLKAYKALL